LQANQALQGAGNDAANVRSNYQSLRGKIKSQLSGLSADQAKYVALNAPKIEAQLASDARAAQAAADAHRAARDLHRQRTQKQFKSSPLGSFADQVAGSFGSIAKTVGTLHAHKPTPEQAGAARTQLDLAHHYIQTYAPAVGLSKIKQMLLTGYSTKKTKIPQISHAGPITPRSLINSAADLYVHRRLSGPNANALYGVPLEPSWRPYTSREMRRYGIRAGSATVRARR
jgi:hypothetical protein